MKKVRLKYQWVPHFFGLTPSNSDVILEKIYIMIYHLGFTYSDAYNLPVWKREWFLNKFIHDLKAEKEIRGAHTSQPRKNTRSNKIFSRPF